MEPQKRAPTVLRFSNSLFMFLVLFATIGLCDASGDRPCRSSQPRCARTMFWHQGIRDIYITVGDHHWVTQ